MSLPNYSGQFAVPGDFDTPEGKRIRDFLQGAVYCWCKNSPKDWFSLADLMGGENTNWFGTPLYFLWEKRKASADPGKEAGIEGGHFLKLVIKNDERIFETRKETVGKREKSREYCWITKSHP